MSIKAKVLLGMYSELIKQIDMLLKTHDESFISVLETVNLFNAKETLKKIRHRLKIDFIKRGII